MRYVFIVKDPVPDDFEQHIPEMSHAPHPTGGTSVFGPVLDLADVSTVRARLDALGLTVISFRPLPD